MKYKDTSFFVFPFIQCFEYGEEGVGGIIITNKAITIYRPSEKGKIFGEKILGDSIEHFFNFLEIEYISLSVQEFDNKVYKRVFRLRKGDIKILEGSLEDFMNFVERRLSEQKNVRRTSQTLQET